MDRKRILEAMDVRNNSGHESLKSTNEDYAGAAEVLIHAIHKILPRVSRELYIEATRDSIEPIPLEGTNQVANTIAKVDNNFQLEPAGFQVDGSSSSGPTYVLVGCFVVCVLMLLPGVFSGANLRTAVSSSPEKVTSSVDQSPQVRNTPRRSQKVSSTFEIEEQQQSKLESARELERDRIEQIQAKHATISPRAVPRSTAYDQIESNSTPLTFTSSIGMELRLIPSGGFVMGTDIKSDSRSHRVEIEQIVYLAVHETTQQEFRTVTRKYPSRNDGIVRKRYPPGWAPSPTHLPDPHARDNLPVENVTWEDATSFCKALTSKDQKAGILAEGWQYRLPTEAEWEYAARAGSTTQWCFGDNGGWLPNYAWYDRTSSGRTQLVGQKQPNAWGFYDMHGNVWEWCHDWYRADYYSRSAAVNPLGPSTGVERVIRGGSFSNDSGRSGSAAREHTLPSSQFNNIGFRVALSRGLPQPSSEQSVEVPVQVLRPNIEAYQAPEVPAQPNPNNGMRFGAVAQRHCNNPDCKGVAVTQVYANQPATRMVMGRKRYVLREGNIITSINGKKVRDYDEFRAAVAASPKHMVLRLYDPRNGSEHDYEVDLNY